MKQMKKIFTIILSSLLFWACHQKIDFDASGNFEADEVIVSAQQNGVLLDYHIQEGDSKSAGDTVGQIDVKVIELQKAQVEAKISALNEQTTSARNQAELVLRQLAVQKAQLKQQLHEKDRTENLLKADAATPKQLDDINAAIEQLQKQTAVTEQQLKLNRYNNQTKNNSILSQKAPLKKDAAGIQQQINKGLIINPITGTVLINYALKGELQVVGKPLYKIANTDTLYLRAYIDGTQLPQIKLGQPVTVRIDKDEKSYKKYSGVITWISDKAEFSPKSIQTKDERANLVYGIKVRVKNDGYLKIGMYAEVIWSKGEQ